MNKILTLSHVMRKCGKVNETADGRSATSANTIYGIFGAIIMVLLFFMGKNFALQSKYFGSVDVVSPSICAVLAIIIFMISIVRLINHMYMSTDLSILTTLPFSPFQLAFSKLIVASVMSFVISFGALIPYSLGYGIYGHMNAFYYISMFLNALVIPIFSMTLAASIIILFFTIFRFARNKDLFSILGIILTMLVVTDVMFFNNSNTNVTDTQQLNVALKSMIDMVSKITVIVPPVYFFGLFSSTGNVLYLTISLLITVLMFVIFYLLSRFFYLKGALSMQNTLSSAKRLTDKDIEKACRKSSQVKAYMKKDFRMLRRTPAYLINCFIMTFVWPILFVVMMFVGQNDMLKSLKAVSEHMDASTLAISTGITFFAVSLVGALNYIAVSSISREGKSFFYMKTMPITYKNQIKAKRNTALIVVNIGTTFYVFVFLLILSCMGRLAWWSPIYGAVLSFILTLISVDAGVMWGVKKANIDWESESQAMQSMYPLAAMGIGMVMTLIITGIEFIVMIFNLPFLIPMTVTLILFAFLSFIINRSMYKYTRKKLNYM